MIEVVAALALMGSLLSAVLVGGSSHLRQMKAASQKRIAVSKLDQFLAAWSISDFTEDGIEDAVERSGVPTIGFFGNHFFQGPENIHSDGLSGELQNLQIEINRTGPAPFGEGSIFRLTVTVPAPHAARKTTAWAEVMSRQKKLD